MDIFGKRKRKKSQYDITTAPHMKPILYGGTEQRTKYNNYVSPNSVPNQGDEVPSKYNHYNYGYEEKVPTKYNHYITEDPALDLRPPYQKDQETGSNVAGNVVGKIGKLFSRTNKVKAETGTPNTNKGADNTTDYKSPYDVNIFFNSVMSGFRHAPTVGSVVDYSRKKENTPDMSSFENATNEAMKPTNVSRQTATHVSGNYKHDPFDYTNGANRIMAQSAAMQNAAAKISRGNTNAFYNQSNNMLLNTASAVGKNNLEGWRAEQEGKQTAYQLNQASDQFNAQADNQAEANYINSKNSAAIQDHNNRINALNNYAQNKYNINHTYEKELDDKRDTMIKNIANEGLNAYNSNKTNTNKKYNYWYDNSGVMHFIDGERPIEAPERQQINISDDMIDKFEQGANVEQKNMLTSLIKQYDGNKAIARQVWANYLINQAKQG